MVDVVDRFGRPLRSLRVSITDRCNLRCTYCMPEPEYVWLPRHDILSYEEIGRVVDAFTDLGVDKVRLTGGEPLLRRDVTALVSQLAARTALRDLALTTNGVLLAPLARELAAAGLGRITVSLDTLRADRFERATRFDQLHAVLGGIDAARAAFGHLKIDTVVVRGLNDDELEDLIAFGRRVSAEVRFIEYMDVGGATHWSQQDVVSRAEILQRLGQTLGPITPIADEDWAPADRFRLEDGTTFGIISSTTEPFCATCDRARLTADGVFLQCLYAARGLDLRTPLREGLDRAGLAHLVGETWRDRTARGAEDRLHAAHRGTFVPLVALKRDAHLEMHTRGG